MQPRNTRSQDFRYVFANTFSVTFGPTEAQVIFGIQDKPGTDDPTMEEQVGLIMTHPAAKLLVQFMNLLIEAHEDAAGAAIPLEPGKLDPIKKAIEDAKDARRASAKKG